MGQVEVTMLICVFLFAGTLKGMFGIGFPAVLMALLTFTYEPRYAMSLIVIAMLITNLRQAFVGGNIMTILLRHKWFCIVASVGIFVVSFYGATASISLLQIVTGFAMILFVISSMLDFIPKLTARWNIPVQVIAGACSAVLGGLTSMWGPPLGMYLTSLRLEKDELIQSMGAVFLIQAVFLNAGMVATGELTAKIALLGIGLLVPAMTGMWIGERLRKRLNMKQFMRMFLILFAVLGANLIRRGLFG